VSGRDRRIHPRVSLQDLSTPALVRIPNRPPISLVDLSPGGALIDLPFQVRPDSRVHMEFRAASERMILPFRMLRCYVRSLRGGVQYQAAGEFEQQLSWEPLAAVSAAQATSNRLIATLEAFQRHVPTSGPIIEFDHLLKWILDAARRGERADRIAVEIRVRLIRLINVVVKPVTTPSLPDPAMGARFFGFDFQCDRALTAPERRLLRAAAQLLSIVDPNANPVLIDAQAVPGKPDADTERPTIVYSVSDWQETSGDAGEMSQDAPRPWPRIA
jgi:hypothetical protein